MIILGQNIIMYVNVMSIFISPEMSCYILWCNPLIFSTILLATSMIFL